MPWNIHRQRGQWQGTDCSLASECAQLAGQGGACAQLVASHPRIGTLTLRSYARASFGTLLADEGQKGARGKL